SLLPVLVSLKKDSIPKYRVRLIQIYSLVTWPSLVVAILFAFWGEKLVLLAFGDDYERSSVSLVILMFASIFVAMNSVNSRYFNVEAMEGKILKRTIFVV